MITKETGLRRQERHNRVLSYTESELKGYLFNSPQAAIKETLMIIHRGGNISMWDVDDTLFYSEPWLRAALNKRMKDANPDFIPVTLAEVLKEGGRYFKVGRYQEAAKKTGTAFSDIFKKVSQDEDIHAYIMPTQSTQKLQSDIAKMGYIIAGYPTARPQTLAKTTAGALKHFGFEEAPVIDVLAETVDPSQAKVQFF